MSLRKMIDPDVGVNSANHSLGAFTVALGGTIAGKF
jgi:hypothetical protein